MDQRNQEDIELLSTCAWLIWGARNDVCFEKVYISPKLCFKRVVDLLNEYRKANVSDQCAKSRRSKAHWTPPEQNSIKINVDAPTKPLEDKIGLSFRLNVLSLGLSNGL
ncbi:unnamed protein product [Amaranthus hypochondriacus]